MAFDYFKNRRSDRVDKAIERLSTEDGSDNSSKKTAEKRVLIICLCAFIVLAALAGTAAGIANHYLNKVNYGDVTGKVDENLDEEEEIDFDIADYEIITDDEEVPEDEDETPVNSGTNGTKAKTGTGSSKSAKKTKKKKTSVFNSIISKIIPESEDYNVLNAGKEIQQKANEEIEKNITESDGPWYSDDVFNLLLIGYDAGDAEKVMFEGAVLPRSDAIIIISVNKKEKTVKMVSLSRATYVAIPDHGNKRLNTAHAYGAAKTLIDTIELNYKIRIDRYISSDFGGFSAIVDALGGVKLKMSAAEASFAFDTDLPAGEYTMNGKQALRYARLRKTDSDRVRTGRQRKILKAICAEAEKMTLSEKLDFMEHVLPYVNTNFSKSELVQYAGQLQTYLNWSITQDIIPHNATKLTMKDGKEVLILDWDETTDYIHSILYSGVEVKKGS